MPEFDQEVKSNIDRLAAAGDFHERSWNWVIEANRYKYAYNFAWLGRPVFQVPQDMQALQEIIWQTQPDLIIETGIARGGSLVFSASMLALLDLCDTAQTGAAYRLQDSPRRVVGIDIDIRDENREAIETHPLAPLIDMLSGSSVDPAIVGRVQHIAGEHRRVLVNLDSNHTHEHVLAELEAYAPLVSPGNYCVVCDTGIEDLPAGFCDDRPWGKGDNPKTAVRAFLRAHPEFEIDKGIEHKIGITGAPDGFLRRLTE